MQKQLSGFVLQGLIKEARVPQAARVALLLLYVGVILELCVTWYDSVGYWGGAGRLGMLKMIFLCINGNCFFPLCHSGF